MQSPEVREKAKETYIEKYGVSNPFQAESVKEKMNKTRNDNYGEDNVSKVRCICHHCNYESSLNTFSNHTKKCFPLHDEEWIKPNSPSEWKKYMKV